MSFVGKMCHIICSASVLENGFNNTATTTQKVL